MRRGALIQAPTVRRHGSFSANSASAVARWLQEVRKSTVVCIFDWGRSELNTMQKCLGCGQNARNGGWPSRSERWEGGSPTSHKKLFNMMHPAPQLDLPTSSVSERRMKEGWQPKNA